MSLDHGEDPILRLIITCADCCRWFFGDDRRCEAGRCCSARIGCSPLTGDASRLLKTNGRKERRSPRASQNISQRGNNQSSQLPRPTSASQARNLSASKLPWKYFKFGRWIKTLPKAQRTRGLSSGYQIISSQTNLDQSSSS